MVNFVSNRDEVVPRNLRHDATRGLHGHTDLYFTDFTVSIIVFRDVRMRARAVSLAINLAGLNRKVEPGIRSHPLLNAERKNCRRAHDNIQ